MNPFVPVLLLALTGASPQPAITKAELVQAMKDANAAIRNASVTCDYKYQTFSPAKSLLLDPAKSHGVCIFDSAGRCRFKGSGEVRAASNDRSQKFQVESAFDGRKLKVIEGQGPRFMHGWVGSRANMRWPLDPRRYVYRRDDGGESIADIIAQPGSKIVGTTTLHGRDLLVVESKEHVWKGGERAKGRYLIDTARGFVVVRVTTRIYRPATKDWFDYSLIEGRNYAEIAPGVWLPADVHDEGYGASATVLKPPQIGRIDVHNSNWVLNADLPDSTFSLKFPAGLLINDQQSGRVYQTIKTNEGDLDAQVVQGVAIYEAARPPFFRRALPYCLLAAVLVAAAGVVWRVRTPKAPRACAANRGIWPERGTS